jgi:hypothetical protein
VVLNGASLPCSADRVVSRSTALTSSCREISHTGSSRIVYPQRRDVEPSSKGKRKLPGNVPARSAVRAVNVTVTCGNPHGPGADR